MVNFVSMREFQNPDFDNTTTYRIWFWLYKPRTIFRNELRYPFLIMHIKLLKHIKIKIVSNAYWNQLLLKSGNKYYW
jgi:hypothetical protein